MASKWRTKSSSPARFSPARQRSRRSWSFAAFDGSDTMAMIPDGRSAQEVRSSSNLAGDGGNLRRMTLTLGDAFNRRKKLAADLNAWTQRLSQAGADRRWYRTQKIEGDGAFVPEAGSDRSTERHYTIEECRERISAIIAEDRDLAMRISLTNQKAMATILDLEGKEVELSVPELLVLKSDIIPKLEQAARAIPTRREGVAIIERGEGFVLQREIKKIERKKETFSEQGMKIEEMEFLHYEIAETKDYGVAQRDAWNEIDEIQDFAQRVKQAINRANKTELVELK
jgi:hypothetical protein